MQLDALAEMGHSRHNMEVFPIGVDVGRFSPVSGYIKGANPSSYPKLIYVGRQYPFKGAPQALQSFTTIRKVHPQATLRIIGPPGDAQCIADMRRFIEAHNLMNVVSIETAVDHSLLPDIYREADLLLYPSMYEG